MHIGPFTTYSTFANRAENRAVIWKASCEKLHPLFGNGNAKDFDGSDGKVYFVTISDNLKESSEADSWCDQTPEESEQNGKQKGQLATYTLPLANVIISPTLTLLED